MIERGESLTALAYKEIETMILGGEIRPGDRLNEHHFAVTHGLSRGPIREACRLLERDGLLVQIPSKGVFVRELSEKQLNEIYDLRAMLIGMMCREAAVRATKAGCDFLAGLNARMKAAAAVEDQDAYYEANLQFHDTIAKIADNETARRVYDGLIKEAHAHRIDAKAFEESTVEHDGIVAALRSGDRDAALRLGEAHVLAGKGRWHEKQRVAAQIRRDIDN